MSHQNIFVLALRALAGASCYRAYGAWKVCRELKKEKARKLKQVEEWRRELYRAPIVKVGTLRNGMPNNDWLFYFPIGEFCTIQTHDPLTGEIVLFGYSLAEFAEIVRQPSEFERPELVDWQL